MALMPFGLRIQAVTFKFFRGTMAINSLVKINDHLTVEASVGQLRSCLKIILSFYYDKEGNTCSEADSKTSFDLSQRIVAI